MLPAPGSHPCLWMSHVNFSVNRVPLSFQLRRFHWRAWRDKEAQSADITVSFERSRNQKFKFEPVTGAGWQFIVMVWMYQKWE